MERSNILKQLAILVALGLLTGCSISEKTADNVLLGGGAGGVLGAGTGAAIGATIAHGDMASSALLGGAVGIPVGIVAAIVIQDMAENAEINGNAELIADNRDEIRHTQEQLDEYREKLDIETEEIIPDSSLREYRYTGPSLGNHYR